MISLNPVEQNIAQIQESTDKTASELAIKRLTVEINDLTSRYSSHLFGAEYGSSGALLLTERVAGVFCVFWEEKGKGH